MPSPDLLVRVYARAEKAEAALREKEEAVRMYSEEQQRQRDEIVELRFEMLRVHCKAYDAGRARAEDDRACLRTKAARAELDQIDADLVRLAGERDWWRERATERAGNVTEAMIEQAARAFYEQDDPGGWDGLDYESKESRRFAAEAALVAVLRHGPDGWKPEKRSGWEAAS